MADRNRDRRSAWRLAKSLQARQDRFPALLLSHLPGQTNLMPRPAANGATCPLAGPCADAGEFAYPTPVIPGLEESESDAFATFARLPCLAKGARLGVRSWEVSMAILQPGHRPASGVRTANHPRRRHGAPQCGEAQRGIRLSRFLASFRDKQGRLTAFGPAHRLPPASMVRRFSGLLPACPPLAKSGKRPPGHLPQCRSGRTACSGAIPNQASEIPLSPEHPHRARVLATVPPRLWRWSLPSRPGCLPDFGSAARFRDIRNLCPG
jgi:hypothetical protein